MFGLFDATTPVKVVWNGSWRKTGRQLGKVRVLEQENTGKMGGKTDRDRQTHLDLLHSDDMGIYAVLQIMQCCIKQHMIQSVIPLQKLFKNTHVWMWSFFQFLEVTKYGQDCGRMEGKMRKDRKGKNVLWVENSAVSGVHFLCCRFLCRAAFQKGHFHQSRLHKPSQLPQNCCAEIHQQPLNTITFSNAVFSVCLYVSLEGHYHNKEWTLHLIAHFHIKVKIKHDSGASLTQNVFDIPVLVSFSKVK